MEQTVINSAHYTGLLRQFGADKVQHSGRTLLDHLLGTARYLQEWGNELPLCLAGLYHSVYGTHDFTVQLIPFSFRADLQRLIGEDAEHLVYLFSAIDRRNLLCIDHDYPVIKNEFSQEYMVLSQPELSHLIEIELANLLDQAVLISADTSLSQTISHYREFMVPHASKQAQAAVLKILRDLES